jgi:hypothetical protein
MPDPTHSGLVTWWRAIGIVVFIFAVPALFRQKSLVRRPFDDTPVKLLRQMRPECVFLGDSMLRSRIDQATLDKVADIPCTVLAYAGSSSAHWYLLHKNVVNQQEPTPRWLIVFFRDKQLTLPAHRAGERYRDGLEKCMRDEETQFTSILGAARQDTSRWMDRLANGTYLIQRKRSDRQNDLQSAALKMVAGQSQRQSIREAADVIFSAKNQRSDQILIDSRNGEMSLDAPGHEFQAHVDQSFLPPMLEMARKNHIRLVFFRVKRRPRSDESKDSTPDLAKYMGELRTYLESHAAVLVDEAGDSDVTLAYYSGDDHVRYDMMGPYTEQFWKKVRPLMVAEQTPGALSSPQ